VGVLSSPSDDRRLQRTSTEPMGELAQASTTSHFVRRRHGFSCRPLGGLQAGLELLRMDRARSAGQCRHATHLGGWIHCLDNFDECVDVVLNNGSTLGESHQQWQLNEILGLVFPASNGIGVMNENLWNQTVDVATTEIPDLAGVDISADAYRTDLAEDAIANISDMDTDGDGYTRRDITLNPGGE